MWDSQLIFANGIMQHVRIGGSGAPMLLLHGWPQTSYCWRKLVPHLSAQHTMIAPDLRGFGESDKPENGYDKRTVANDVRALLVHLGHRNAVVVGHDIGAQVAFRLALDHPDLVSKLVILNGRYPPLGSALMYSAKHAPERWYYFFHQIPQLPEQIVTGNVRAYIGHFLEHWSHPDFHFTEQDLDYYAAAFAREGALAGGFNHYRAAGREDVEQWTQDEHRTIDTPTLVLWGRHDPVNSPEYSDGYHRVLRAMRFCFIERCGHFPQEERPDETAQAMLAFIESANTGVGEQSE